MPNFARRRCLRLAAYNSAIVLLLLIENAFELNHNKKTLQLKECQKTKNDLEEVKHIVKSAQAQHVAA